MAKLKPILKRPSLSRKKKAVAPEDFGKIGERLNQSQPFYFGFLAASGAVIAITLLRAFASASQVFVLIIISLFFAMGLNPAVLFIERRGLNRSKSVAVTVSTVVAFVGLFIWVAAPLIIDHVLISIFLFVSGTLSQHEYAQSEFLTFGNVGIPF